MADVEHKTLDDAELHEPKGIASAISGQILVANGSGSGSWQLGNNFSAQYAGWFILNNSTGLVVPIASDSTLHTGSDYVPMPASLTTRDINSGVTFDINDAFVIAETGIYIFQGWASISSTGTNNTVGLSFSSNGVFLAPSRPVIKIKLKAAGDIVTATGFGLTTLDSGDVIRAGIADDTGSTVTFHESSFFLHKISN